VSEQILKGTSAQLCYTVPFMLDNLENTQIKKKTQYNSEKANNAEHSKAKLP